MRQVENTDFLIFSQSDGGASEVLHGQDHPLRDGEQRSSMAELVSHSSEVTKLVKGFEERSNHRQSTS